MPQMGFAKGKNKIDLGQSNAPDLKGETDYRHTVAHMDPENPAFESHRGFLTAYQRDYRDWKLWNDELQRAYRDGASDEEIAWIKDAITRSESRLKTREHEGPFALALRAGEAAKAQGGYHELSYEMPPIVDRPRKQFIMNGTVRKLSSTSELPFAIYDLVRDDGEEKQRRFFNGDKVIYTDYDPIVHVSEKDHLMGGHKHLYDAMWEGKKKRREAFEITQRELTEQGDIFSYGERGNVYRVSGAPHGKRR